MPGPSDEHVACSLATLFVSSLREGRALVSVSLTSLREGRALVSVSLTSLREGRALVYGARFTNVTHREHSFGVRCRFH